MRKTLTILCFLALSLTKLTAQKAILSGILTDAGTGDPLIAATVVAGTSGTITDVDGSYTLTLTPGQHTIIFRYVGYESVTNEVGLEDGQTLELNGALKQQAAILETATVTSGKHSKPLSEVTVSLEVLRPNLIQSTGKLSLDAAIEKLPGVTVIDGQANIRAGSGYSQGAGSRVLLLVDDIPILTADAGYPNWDDVPIENISQVEVVKGAASALFGSSALNGIINVRTAYPKAKPETEGAVYYTHVFDPADKRNKWWDSAPYTVGAQLAHRRKIGKLDLVLGSYYVKEESFNKDAYKEYGRFNFSTRYRVSDRLTLGLNGNFNTGKSGAFFYWVSDTMAYVGVPSTFSNRERVRFNIDPYVNYYDRSGNRHRLQGRFYNVDNNNDNNQGNTSDMYYAEYQFQRQMQDIGLVVSAGAVYQGTNIEAELYGDTTFTSRNYAAYLQLDKKLFDRLNLSAGFRYEDNLLKNPGFIYMIGNKERVVPASNERESKPVVRFGLNYRLAEATFLRASWGQGYRFPTVAEKFIVTNVGFFNVLPSPGLRSETGWSAEIGIKQGFQISSFKGYLDLAAFTFRYFDMMEFNLVTLRDSIDNTLSSDFRSINIGDTKAAGFEVTAAGQGDILGLPFTLLAGYTFVDPRFLEFDTTSAPIGDATIAQVNAQNSSSDENILKYRSRHLFKLDLETTYKGAFLGLEVFHNSNIEAIDSPFLLIINGLRRFREAHDKGFTVFNLRTGYAFSDHLKLSLLLNNVANAEYSSRPGLLDAPRNLTARVDFKF
ncbi:MAG: TonB-dependent receptor [Phaeodactylibacter sp.]|nr:TonB-dependent receptor [Phaeodactylibacter sp.]MCB9276989.1 TonB-dependent receptor [Lewinellaceae bacterium]